MRPPLRIAILECDTPLTETRKKYGGYGGVFTALLQAGADYLNRPELISSRHGLKITCYDVVTKMEYPADLDKVDAILLTGSKHDSFGDDEWILKLVEYTKIVLEQQSRVRVIGVCFGHQIVGRALNVKVGRNTLAWEVSVTSVELTEKGRELFDTNFLNIQQMHRDVVYEYPASVTALGETSVCKVQGMYERGRLITIQGHPEFNEQIVREIIETRYAQGIFDDKLYKDALSRVGNHHDGVKVSAAFLRFLLED